MPNDFAEHPGHPRKLAASHQLIDGLGAELERLRADETESPPAVASEIETPRRVLQHGVRLSESRLWALQENHYMTTGISAWVKVPHYATSNPYIADANAELIIAFIQDYWTRLDLDEPLYVIELGAGTGYFSHYLLQELERKRGYFADLDRLKLQYVMTDIVPDNIRFWGENEQLAKYRNRGQLDFALFRPEHDAELSLQVSGRRLVAGDFKNPVIVIANYVFDGIRQDCYRVLDGKLQEARYTLYLPANDLDEPEISRVQYEIEYVDADPDAHQDPFVRKLLHEYAARTSEFHILLPLGAFDCVRNMLRLSGDNMLLLSADKGFTDPVYMAHNNAHAYILHGSFSFMVNYHAIGRLLEERKGVAIGSSAIGAHVVTQLGYCLRDAEVQLEHCHYVFTEQLARRDANNTLFDLHDLLQDRDGNYFHAHLSPYLTVLRLCNFDMYLLSKFGEKICSLVGGSNERQIQDLLDVLAKVGERYYAFPSEYMGASWLGQIYFRLNNMAEALKWYTRCIDLRPDAADTYYAIGMAYKDLGKNKEAADVFERYLAHFPDGVEAPKLRQYIAILRSPKPGISPPAT